MTDNEYDDELPQISLHNSKPKNKTFTMPSADILASQRAREEECEHELQLLRSHYEIQDKIHNVSLHDSSSSDGEITLSTAIESMKVQCTQTSLQLDAADLLERFISNIPHNDTQFLSDYLQILKSGNIITVKAVTENIISTIEQVLKHNHVLSEQELLVTSLWLFASCLWNQPRVPSARNLLNILLTSFNNNQVEALCSILAQSMDSAVLVQASDVITVPHCAPRRCAALLLRAALAKLQPSPLLEPKWEPLRLEEIQNALPTVWRDLSAPAQYTAVQIVGRVLAEESSTNQATHGEPKDVVASSVSSRDCGSGVSQLLTLLATPPPNRRYQPDYLKVLVAVAKLQVLFRDK